MTEEILNSQHDSQVRRKYYIDNIRWICILLLVPFHCTMAWNSWGEGNYIWFYENRGLSTFIVMISPWYMSLLFVLAGMSARYSLQRRSYGQFIKERVLKLFLPLVIGMLTVIALITYYAEKFHNGYADNFFTHYKIFFTKFTDLTGYDGGWTPGHLWFLLYLFLISIISIGPIVLQKKYCKRFTCKNLSAVKITVFGVLPIVFSPILNFGGKSIGFYMILYLLGYYVFSEDEIMHKIVKYRSINLTIMMIANVLDVYMFIWTENVSGVLNTIVMYITCWFGILTILGFSRDYFNQSNRFTKYLTSRSFLFYIFHFMWLVLFQFYLSRFTTNVYILFIVPVIGTYLMTFLTIEIVARIPGVDLLFGANKISEKRNETGCRSKV